MNLNRARYILTIVSKRSFSAAAESLYITQSALSQTVRQEENELGVTLFCHKKGRSELTPAGEIYVETAGKMLQMNENLRNKIRELNNENAGSFRFGISAQQGRNVLPAILGRFFEAFPLIEPQITERGSATLEQMIRDRQLDLALVRTSCTDQNTAYTLRQDEIMGLLAGRNCKLNDKYPHMQPLHLSDAAEEKFVSLKSGHNARAVQDMLRIQEGVRLNEFIELDTFETAIRVTVECGCVMTAPYSILRREQLFPAQAHFYPLIEAPLVQKTALIYSQDLHLTRYMKYWIELIGEYFNSSRPDYY